MAEDAYRAEIIHKWRMRRLDETIQAIRALNQAIDEDIASVLQTKGDYSE